MVATEDKPYILIRQLEVQIASLREDLSTVQQCYYEVVDQRNKALEEVARLRAILAKDLKRGGDNG